MDSRGATSRAMIREPWALDVGARCCCWCVRQVSQASRQLHFSLEATNGGVAALAGTKELDRGGPPEQRVTRAPHLAHSAFADPGFQRVLPEHVRCWIWRRKRKMVCEATVARAIADAVQHAAP